MSSRILPKFSYLEQLQWYMYFLICMQSFLFCCKEYFYLNASQYPIGQKNKTMLSINATYDFIFFFTKIMELDTYLHDHYLKYVDDPNQLLHDFHIV